MVENLGMLKRGITTVTVRHFSRKLTGKETDSKNIVQLVKDTAQKTKKVREARQHFSNFLVIDFEATCNRSGPRPNPQVSEITPRYPQISSENLIINGIKQSGKNSRQSSFSFSFNREFPDSSGNHEPLYYKGARIPYDALRFLAVNFKIFFREIRLPVAPSFVYLLSC